MQNYYDPATGKQYAFDDSVVVTGSQGDWVFTAPNGAVLGPYPNTMKPGIAPVIAPTLTQAQATQIGIVNAAAQAALAAIIAAYPDLEVATWPQQYSEALAYTASNTAATPMLSVIATAASSTVAAMAESVMAKASAYQAASGAVIGKRIALTAQIDAAATVTAVQAVTW